MLYDPPKSEPELIRDLVDVNLEFVSHMKCPHLRSEHGKGVADVKAVVTILEHIPDHLQTGLFKSPGEYEAIIRFSNSAKFKDNERDTHGMAMKVFGVPMDTAPVGEDGVRFQDFIMLDSPFFPMGDLKPYIPFNADFLEAKYDLMGKLKLFGMLITRPKVFWQTLQLALRRPNAPLATSYWSTTPYQLGDSQVVKYKAVPIRGGALPPPIVGPQGRRDALKRDLAQGPGLMTFGVIVQDNPETQPVEDPSVDWEKAGADFVPVAEIRIPSDQPVDAAPEVENALRFNPGHAAHEHFPLGAINRARVAVYNAASRMRQAEMAKGK